MRRKCFREDGGCSSIPVGITWHNLLITSGRLSSHRGHWVWYLVKREFGYKSQQLAHSNWSNEILSEFRILQMHLTSAPRTISRSQSRRHNWNHSNESFEWIKILWSRTYIWRAIILVIFLVCIFFFLWIETTQGRLPSFVRVSPLVWGSFMLDAKPRRITCSLPLDDGRRLKIVWTFPASLR